MRQQNSLKNGKLMFKKRKIKSVVIVVETTQCKNNAPCLVIRNELENLCSCKFNNSCLKCGDLEDSHMGSTFRINDMFSINPCSKPPINRGINFDQNIFITNFQKSNYNGKGLIAFFLHEINSNLLILSLF